MQIAAATEAWPPPLSRSRVHDSPNTGVITIGKKSRSGSHEVRRPSLDAGDAARNALNSYDKQRPQFEARAEFVKTYRRARRNGGQPKLDPVLASRLGLEETARKEPHGLSGRKSHGRKSHAAGRNTCDTLKLMTQATYDDANLLLRLYEIRREPKMREARAWFAANFKPKTLAEVQELCPPGSENSARMRMVVSYWDMAASFITAGVLNPELFFVNNREMLVVWVRLRNLLPEMRAAYKEPTFWENLEAVGEQFTRFLERTSPGTFDAFTARVGG